MTRKLDYRKLPTSNNRKEKPSDHATLEKMMKSQWKNVRDFSLNPFPEINGWQFNRVKDLVEYAYRHVPLYRNKYSQAGFEPGDLNSWKDFEALPILYKEELIDGFPEQTISDDYGYELTTRSSGSSGKFVTLAVSKEAVYIDTIQGVRQFYSQSGRNYHPNDFTLFIYTSPWWVSSVNGKYPTDFLSTSTPVNKAIKHIYKTHPAVLSTYPTYLKMLCHEKARLKEAGIKLVVIHSEQSSQKERIELSDYLKVPVLDEFSSEELTRIALECPNRHYHLEEDASYIEIVDVNTKKKISKGNQGLLVGTNLINRATPVIRYHQGDIASISRETKCLCGSNFRIMDPVAGRYMDSIITMEGKVIPASCFMDLAYDWFLRFQVPVHGLKYQFVQVKEGSITIYIAPGAYKLTEANIESIRKSIYTLLPWNMQICVSIVSKVPYDNGTKYRSVISFKKR